MSVYSVYWRRWPSDPWHYAGCYAAENEIDAIRDAIVDDPDLSPQLEFYGEKEA